MKNRAEDQTVPTDDVVVGLDDSASARAALTWAAAWVRRMGGRLRVVHAEPPALAGPPMGYPVAPWGVDFPDREADVRQKNRADITGLFQSLNPEPSWALEFADGHAGAALVQASRSASLLVIGTRQIGPIERLASGSVSSHCVRHSHCPVLVVPADRPYPAIPRTAAATAAS